MNKKREQIIPQIKRMIREAYIDKHFTQVIRTLNGKHTETIEFDVRHLVFCRRRVCLLGEYNHLSNNVALNYERLLELIDNEEAVHFRVSDVEFIYRLEEKEGKQ